MKNNQQVKLPDIEYLDHNKADFTAMGKELNINLEDCLEGKTTKEMAGIIVTAINDAVIRNTPTRTRKYEGIRVKPQWMDWNVLRHVKKKYHSWIRYLNIKDGHDYLTYIQARNKAAHEYMKGKEELWELAGQGSKAECDSILAICEQQKGHKIDLQREDGRFCTDDKEKA